MLIWNPNAYDDNHKGVEGPSAWKGLDRIMVDVLNRFEVGRDRALEFGVEFGYSCSVLAQLFGEVTGVDLFAQRKVIYPHDTAPLPYIDITRGRLSGYPHVTLVEKDWKAYAVEHDDQRYDLVHIDMDHSFEQTYESGLWAINHATIAIFHDTEAFVTTKNALLHIEETEEGVRFFHYPPHCGLGILARRDPL